MECDLVCKNRVKATAEKIAFFWKVSGRWTLHGFCV